MPPVNFHPIRFLIPAFMSLKHLLLSPVFLCGCGFVVSLAIFSLDDSNATKASPSGRSLVSDRSLPASTSASEKAASHDQPSDKSSQQTDVFDLVVEALHDPFLKTKLHVSPFFMDMSLDSDMLQKVGVPPDACAKARKVLNKYLAEQTNAEASGMKLEFSDATSAILRLPADATARSKRFRAELEAQIGSKYSNFILENGAYGLKTGTGDFSSFERILKVFFYEKNHPNYDEEKYAVITMKVPADLDLNLLQLGVSEKNGAISAKVPDVEVLDSTCFEKIPAYLSHILTTNESK